MVARTTRSWERTYPIASVASPHLPDYPRSHVQIIVSAACSRRIVPNFWPHLIQDFRLEIRRRHVD